MATHSTFAGAIGSSLAWRSGLAAFASAALVGFSAVPTSALETRSYVVSWFSLGAYSQNGDCAGGINPPVSEQYRRNLVDLGKTPEEIEAIIRKWEEGGISETTIMNIMNDRARIDGEPANAYANPEAVVDPMLNWVTGKYAYGFDLDGKGTASPQSFEDPETGQKGVDSELFRSLGCARAFRSTNESTAAYWGWVWTTIRDSMPAWLITISGENLNRDGPVTITFNRALESVTINAHGKVRGDVTFRKDPDPGSRNVFRGRLEDGVVSITEPGEFRMVQAAMSMPEVKLKETHFRLKLRSDGSADGFLAGYQSWRDIYFGIAQGGFNAEITVTGDIPGLYYLLKRFADAEPDPVTGQNGSISSTYRIEAVPAFVVPAKATGVFESASIR